MSAQVETPSAAVAAPLSENVAAALNLGWLISELRGRACYGDCAIPGPNDATYQRHHALPLGGEHTRKELLISTRVAAILLAERLGVSGEVDGAPDPALEIRTLCEELDKARTNAKRAQPKNPLRRADSYNPRSEVGRAWDKLADGIYHWDEQLQDRLGVSVELISAYQLGRGLSDAFWALDPAASAETPPRPSSWEFLLCSRRRDLLIGHLRRLEGVLQPFTGPAVSGPLRNWCALSEAGELRDHSDAPAKMREQLQIWRDVLLGSRNPASFARNPGWSVGIRQVLRAAKAYALETTISVICVGLLVFAGYFLGSSSHRHGVGVAISILAIFGITGSAVGAKAKTQARQLIGELSLAFYSDVVSVAASTLPAGVKARRFGDDA